MSDESTMIDSDTVQGLVLIAAIFVGGYVGLSIDKTVDAKMIEEATALCANRGGLLSLEATVRDQVVNATCIDGTRVEKGLNDER